MHILLYSITDKVNFITASGFKRLLIDFSKTKVSRSQIKAITASMLKGQPLPEVSRFNWKDGFYSPQQIEEYKAANERANAMKNSAGRAQNRSYGNKRPSGGTPYNKKGNGKGRR